MAGRVAPQGWLDHGAGALFGAAALVIALLDVSPAMADGSRPLLVSAPVAQSAGEPSVLDRIARWFDRSVADLDEGLRDTFGSAGKFGGRPKAAAAEDPPREPNAAVQPLAAIPDVRIVTESAVCPSAANGAPDCRRAAETVCRRKGFASGKSIETRSEEKCSLGAMLARRAGQPDTCHNQTYVLRSVCQ
jgi:hypothetical protein